jgi:hypothetical protein
MIEDWHFSQGIGAGIQSNMPLYTYTKYDTVLVLTIDGITGENRRPVDPNTDGGWAVTVKKVAVNDLIGDAVGNVRTSGTKLVENVLLFTLETIEPFVLNADDYNAVQRQITFNPDANTATNEGGWNPFTVQGTTTVSGLPNHGEGPLTAFEVNDSLYRYGYLQFAKIIGTDSYWLQVDTGFWNTGVDEFLRFGWSETRRDTSFATAKWGTTAYETGRHPAGKPNPSEAQYVANIPLYKADSAAYVLNYHKDSLMENQSKFRVVYYPDGDTALINVYQSRYQNKNYDVPPLFAPEAPAWWTNSFDTAYSLISGKPYGPADSIIAAGAGNDEWLQNVLPNKKTDNGGKLRPRPTHETGTNRNFFHSLMDWYDVSSFTRMDKVLISTADTSVFSYYGEPLSHRYGAGTETNNPLGGGVLYKDSLFYVDVQNLITNGKNIATLSQSSTLNSNIYLQVAPDCDASTNNNPKAYIPDDLYLIRNHEGQFLAVPIWSITDSVYWITPEENEDPTQIPAYQWVVENIYTTTSGQGSPFRLINREFEKVVFDYAYVMSGKDTTLQLGGNHSASRLNRQTQATVDGEKASSMGKGDFVRSRDTQRDLPSFIPLNSGVKSDQLLGYTYIDKDSAYVDVYAFKYYHFMALGENANYLGYHPTDDDTIVYAKSKEYIDKAYFALEDMPKEIIRGAGELVTNDNPDYADIYNRYGSKQETWQNKDIVLEHFGYVQPKSRQTIPDLKPLARQAYRLVLKDYFMFSPTIQGDYVTIGQQDNYVFAAKSIAERPWDGTPKHIEGLFGLPYFYFRNTYFNIEGSKYVSEDNAWVEANENYFALIQRVDTVVNRNGTLVNVGWENIKAYIKEKFGQEAADKVGTQIKSSGELGVFIAQVEETTAKFKFGVRGDNAVRVSTFTLEQDDDPIYRRFHWNDKFSRIKTDGPLTLEFHRVNNSEEALFENTGADTRTGGGFEYNLIDVQDWTSGLKTDSLGNVLSFLGYKNKSQFPSEINADGYPTGFIGTSPEKTNYSFYVDTAYINRGTGWIKPQYMLVVDTLTGSRAYYDKCKCEEDPGFTDYVLGRYLYNTSMFAKQIYPDTLVGTIDYSNTWDVTLPIKQSILGPAINGVPGKYYTESSFKWERLAFAWAIHRGDELFVLKISDEIIKDGDKGYLYKQDPQLIHAALLAAYPTTDEKYIDWDKLRAIKGRALGGNGVNAKIGVHAVVNLGNNYHKDWVFSFRYFERGSDDFIIESETENRDWTFGATIRPGYGGWVKLENGVPVITRSDAKYLLQEGEFINVKKTDIAPVSNDKVSQPSSVAVAGGTGNVTILNATGKKVVISNMLGQTVASTILSSDNATIAVPRGVVVVAVEGESAVKAVVK